MDKRGKILVLGGIVLFLLSFFSLSHSFNAEDEEELSVNPQAVVSFEGSFEEGLAQMLANKNKISKPVEDPVSEEPVELPVEEPEEPIVEEPAQEEPEEELGVIEVEETVLEETPDEEEVEEQIVEEAETVLEKVAEQVKTAIFEKIDLSNVKAIVDPAIVDQLQQNELVRVIVTLHDDPSIQKAFGETESALLAIDNNKTNLKLLSGAQVKQIVESKVRQKKELVAAYLDERTKTSRALEHEVLNNLVTKQRVGSENEAGASAAEGIDFIIKSKYLYTPGFSGQITKQGLQKLAVDKRVKSIRIDRLAHIDLVTSNPLVNGTTANTVTVNGSNVTGLRETVCVLDSGIDPDHPDFGSRVVATGCNCTVTNLGGGGCCPNTMALDTDAEDDNGHGTLAAGVIASENETYRGIAPEAGIIGVKIFNASGDGLFSDINDGIEFCISKAVTLNVSVISMSLGDGIENGDPQDCVGFTTDILLDQAHGLGILSVASSGNDGFSGGIGYPACVPNVTSVGASFRNDTVVNFSNQAPFLDIVAPGVKICGSRAQAGVDLDAVFPAAKCASDTDTLHINASGTSFSSPHVAGAALLVFQNEKLRGNTISPDEVREFLKNSTDIFVNKSAADVTNTSPLKPRLNIFYTLAQLNLGVTLNTSSKRITHEFGEIEYPTTPTFENITDCLFITENHVEINSSSCSQLNRSSFVTIKKLSFINPRVLRDGGPCPGSICSNISYDGENLTFNTTEFSVFSAAEINGTCREVNESITLINDVESSDDCFTFTADDVILDCAGFTINYSTVSEGTAINATNRNNITIEHCNIDQGSTIEDSFAIVFENTTNSTIDLNNITVRGVGADAINLLPDTNFTEILDNFIDVRGINASGIFLDHSSDNLLENNTISLNDLQDPRNNFTVTGLSGPDRFVIDGNIRENLTLTRGVIYSFSVSSPGHTFYISSDGTGGGGAPGRITDGVTNDLISSGTTTFLPNIDHDDTIYYQCGIHTNMGAFITLLDNEGSAIELFGDSKNNILLNNNLSTKDETIFDETGDGNINQFIYNNSFGEISWINDSDGGFLKNLTFFGIISLVDNLSITNNTAFFNTSAFDLSETLINSSANITFSTVSYVNLGNYKVLKNGVPCI